MCTFNFKVSLFHILLKIPWNNRSILWQISWDYLIRVKYYRNKLRIICWLQTMKNPLFADSQIDQSGIRKVVSTQFFVKVYFCRETSLDFWRGQRIFFVVVVWGYASYYVVSDCYKLELYRETFASCFFVCLNHFLFFFALFGDLVLEVFVKRSYSPFVHFVPFILFIHY